MDLKLMLILITFFDLISLGVLEIFYRYSFKFQLSIKKINLFIIQLIKGRLILCIF